MSIRIGGTTLSAAYLGGIPVSKIYLGSNLLYSYGASYKDTDTVLEFTIPKDNYNLTLYTSDNGRPFGNGSINWGDGSIDTSNNTTRTHTYTKAGTYTVAGEFSILKTVGQTAAFEHHNTFKESLVKVVNIRCNNDTLEEAFKSCANLKEVDLSKYDATNVTSMKEMFSGCSKLTKVNMSGINTKNVIDMSGMYENCSSISSNADFGVSHLNTSGVYNMARMFNGCTSLTTLNLTNFNTKNVVSMFGMFWNCYNLSSLNLESFVTANVVDFTGMFAECRSIVELDLSSFEATKAQSVTNLFYGCSKLEYLYLDRFRFTKSLIEVNGANATFNMFAGCKNLYVVELLCMDEYSATRVVEQLPIDGNNTVEALAPTPVAMKMKEKFASLELGGKVIFIPLSGLNVYEIEIESPNTAITLYSNMRGGNKNTFLLSEVFKTTNWGMGAQIYSSDTNFTYPYARKYTILTSCCTNNGRDAHSSVVNRIKGIYGINNTMTDLSYFANGLTALETVCIGEDYCTSIITGESLVDTAATTTLDMFANCTSLKNVNIDLAFKYVFDATGMFYNCRKMETIENMNSWTMDSIEWSQGTFRECASLKEVDLSNWKTSKLQGIADMFNGASVIRTANLSNWDLSSLYLAGNFSWASPWLDVIMDNVPYSTIEKFVDVVGAISPCEGGAIYYNYTKNTYNETTEHNLYAKARAKGWATTDPNYNCFAIWVNAGTTISVSDNKGDTSSSTHVDWGDGTIDKSTKHTYANAGHYLVKSKRFGQSGSSNDSKKYTFTIHMLNKNMTSHSTLTENSSVTNIRFDRIDFSKSTNVQYMLSGYKGEHIDLSGLSNSVLPTLRGMFWGNKIVKSVKLHNLNCSKLTNMSVMFSDCSNLQTVDIKNWSNMRNGLGINMSNMFQGCSSIQILDLSALDVASVSNFTNLFGSTKSLTLLNLSGWSINSTATMGSNPFAGSSIRRSGIITTNTDLIERLIGQVPA